MTKSAAKLSAVLVVVALTCPGAVSPALGATVSVSEEQPGIETRATLHFDAAPGESNDVTVDFSEASPTEFRVDLHDEWGGMLSGHGCSVTESSGKEVVCSLHRPHSVEYTYCGRSCANSIPGSGWTTNVSAALGDGDNAFRMNFPGGGGGAIDVTATAGDGNDTIVTSEGEDRIEAGGGNDEIHTNSGSDSIVAPPAPDGPDVYDLGPDYNVIDYSARSAPVLYSVEGEGNSGAPGEGDTVRGAIAVLTGSGDDVLSGGPAVEHFVSGDGNDQLHGGGGEDDLNGEGGENQLYGEDGNDRLAVERLSPPSAGNTVIAPSFADGGAGDDSIYMAAGPDRASGGPGNDVFKMGAGDDVAAGGPGEDRIYGDEGADLLAGEEDADTLVGNEGRDQMLGGPGDDRLIAGVITHGVSSDPARIPRGPFDGWSDRVSCGDGDDVAVANPWDALQDCERTVSILAVGLGRLRGSGHPGSRVLPVEVSGPGRLILDGPGILRRIRDVTESSYGRPYFHNKNKVLMVPLALSLGSRRTLGRRGQLRLQVTARFFPVGGVPRATHSSLLLGAARTRAAGTSR